MPVTPPSSSPRIRSLILDPEPCVLEVLTPLLTELAFDPEFMEADDVNVIDFMSGRQYDVYFLPVEIFENGNTEKIMKAASDSASRMIVVGNLPGDAQKAFDVGATDFLLKPLDQERCRQSMLRMTNLLRERDVHGSNGALHGNSHKPLEYIAVRQKNRITFVRTADIDWLEACGMYVKVHVKAASPLIRRSLHELESRLDPHRFVRIHRSSIINLDRLKDLQASFGGDFQVTLIDGTQLTLSRRFRSRFSAVVGELL